MIETDAPFILPYCKDVIQPKLLRRARNTSLILPAVIKKIAEQKSIRDSAEMLHKAIPGSSLEIMPGLRHGDLSINKPEQYAKILTDLLGETL